MSLIKCSKCGNEFEENLKVCPECGESVADVDKMLDGENTNQDESVNEDVVSEDSKIEDNKEVVNESAENCVNEENKELSDENHILNVTVLNKIKSFLKNENLLKSNKMKIIIAGIVIVVIAVSYPKIQEHVKLNKSYKHAVELLNEGKYDDAAKAFSKLDDYKDSEKQYLNCFYSEGVDNFEDSKYQAAIECFEKAEDYKDTGERLKETHFFLAEEEYGNGNYLKASEEYLAADDYKDANEKYEKAIYEYGKELASKYDYDAAAEQLAKIDYEDSNELAERYERMQKERFFNDRFYYATEEFALLLDKNINKQESACSAKLTNEVDAGAYITTYYYSKKSSACVMLRDIDKEDGSLGEIMFFWEDFSDSNGSLEVATLYVCIRMADLTLSDSDAKELATNMVNLGTKTQNKNGITYESAFEGTALGLKIYPTNVGSVA